MPGTTLIPSPNIWHSPEVYEVENRAVDRGGVIEAAMREIHHWSGLDVLDVGCGSGFHLPRLAVDARSVVGVEPHPPLALRARARVAGLPGVRVVAGRAEATGLPDSCVDVAHARWAYFFGPGCAPGLAELTRVIRPGGAGFVIDTDATRSSFGAWFRESVPTHDPAAVERFWRRQGWRSVPLDITWEFEQPEDFAAVVRIELCPAVAERILAADPTRSSVDYAVWLRWREF